MIKRFIALILLSLSSLAALAVPTVTDVEKTIVSGDYDKAKEQLGEVLKVHPDSVVANKYMLEIIKIEYAGSLKPSVEFKIYENKLKQIEADKQARIVKEQEAKRELQRQENWRIARNIFYTLLALIVVVLVGTFLGKRLEAKQAREEILKWKAFSNERFVELNFKIGRLVDDGNYKKTETEYGVLVARDLKNLFIDNNEARKAVENDDYNRQAIENHFHNAYSLLDKLGIE